MWARTLLCLLLYPQGTAPQSVFVKLMNDYQGIGLAFTQTAD